MSKFTLVLALLSLIACGKKNSSHASESATQEYLLNSCENQLTYECTYRPCTAMVVESHGSNSYVQCRKVLRRQIGDNRWSLAYYEILTVSNLLHAPAVTKVVARVRDL